VKKLIFPIIGGILLTLLALTLIACGGKTTASSSPAASTAVVTTLAGKAGVTGSVDGTGAAARFNGPAGITCDTHGNLYVADSNSNIIRKITPAGVVTTLAGKAGSAGSANGVGAAARFDDPVGIACNAAGELYVSDSNNATIRKITPAGVVTTLAGKAGVVAGNADGVGAAARFNYPMDVTCDAAGNLYVADTGNGLIRKVTPAGVVTTLTGQAGVGSADGSVATATFYAPQGIACDAAGNLYVADTSNNTIRKITFSH
jgi:sugar lactone lactonase YvrE